MKQPRNTAAFVCGLIGSIFAIIGGLVWTACAAACASATSSLGLPDGSATLMAALFAIFGIGGGIITLVGACLAFGYKMSGAICLCIGTLFQIAFIIVIFTQVGSVAIYLMFWPFVSLILSIVATILAFVKKKPQIPPQAPQAPQV